eukprot:gene12288-biopygen9478
MATPPYYFYILVTEHCRRNHPPREKLCVGWSAVLLVHTGLLVARAPPKGSNGPPRGCGAADADRTRALPFLPSGISTRSVSIPPSSARIPSRYRVPMWPLSVPWNAKRLHVTNEREAA